MFICILEYKLNFILKKAEIIKNLPKFAVLLTVFNGMKFIEKQVYSILNQKYVSLDLFVSIDHSTDGSYEWFVDISKKYNKKIKILPYGEKFGSSGKNFFRIINDVNFNSYDYIALSDQDDIWHLNKLQRACNIIKTNNVEGYSSNVIVLKANETKKNLIKSHTQKQFDYFFESAGPGCTYVFKRNSIIKFKSFIKEKSKKINKFVFHDWLIYAFFRANKMAWFIDSKAMMDYRSHTSNVIGPNTDLKAYFKRFKMILNGFYFSQFVLISSLFSDKKNLRFCTKKLFLIKNFWQLRRSPLDAFILLLFLLFFYSSDKSFKSNFNYR